MTKKLYYEFPYVKKFDALVVSCEKCSQGYHIILDQTGFYPEGGGQPGDTGRLNEINITDVHEIDGIIYHTAAQSIEAGQTVHGVLNWKERFSNMQNHTGEHIISGIIHELYGYDNIGFHMGQDAVTIDINGILTMDALLDIEERGNQYIYDNLPVQILYAGQQESADLAYRSKKELTGEVRIVKVQGADTCACCGTHVASTGEIGIIKLIGLMKYKSGIRISMLCGYRALKDYQQKQTGVQQISVLLSAKQGEIGPAVKKIYEENHQKAIQMGELYRQLFAHRAASITEGQNKIIFLEEHLPSSQLRHFATALIEKGQLIFICAGNERSGYSYVAASTGKDMKEFGQKLNQALNGKGGGSKEMVQGTLYTTWPEIEAFIKAWE